MGAGPEKPTAAGSSMVAPKISREPIAAKFRGRRGLATGLEVVTKPWTKASKATGIGGYKDGEEGYGKKHENKENGKKRDKKNNGHNHQKKKKNGKKLEKKKNKYSRELKP